MLWAALAAIAVAVLAIVIGVLASGGPPLIHFPDSIAGRQRMSSSAIQGFAEGLATQASIGSLRPQVAFYGTGMQPSFVVVAYADAPTAEGNATLWEAYLEGSWSPDKVP